MSDPAPRPCFGLPRSQLGEGPWWDADAQLLIWVDITGHSIHRWHPASGRCDTQDVGVEVGFAMLDGRGRLIAGLGDGIFRLDGPVRELLARPAMHAENRFNDAACDPRGRLWAGTMHAQASRDRVPTGALYRFAGGKPEAVATNIAIANGLGWSPDGATLYFADTHRGIVWAYAYDLATGVAGGRRIFAEVPRDTGVPDGLTVDGAGRVYVAIWRGGRVDVFAPDGAHERAIATPVRHPTSCCFGGADLRTLYITTARNGLTPEEQAGDTLSGCLFALQMETPGLPSPRVTSFDDGGM